jgi:hypothetical protein
MGIMLSLICWMVIAVGMVFGQQSVLGLNVFGVHTLLFASFGTFAGNLFWGAGLLLSARHRIDTRFSGKLLRIPEDALLGLLMLLGVLGLVFVGRVFYVWQGYGFVFLNLEGETLTTLTVGMNLFLLIYNLMMAHMIARD